MQTSAARSTGRGAAVTARRSSGAAFCAPGRSHRERHSVPDTGYYPSSGPAPVGHQPEHVAARRAARSRRAAYHPSRGALQLLPAVDEASAGPAFAWRPSVHPEPTTLSHLRRRLSFNVSPSSRSSTRASPTIWPPRGAVDHATRACVCVLPRETRPRRAPTRRRTAPGRGPFRRELRGARDRLRLDLFHEGDTLRRTAASRW